MAYNYGITYDFERLKEICKVGGDYVCKLDKMPDGTLSSINDAKICDINHPLFSTITQRYYKGICSHKDNMIIEVKKLDDLKIDIRQATKSGIIPCKIGGGIGSELSNKQHTQGQGAIGWEHMPNTYNGEYP